VNVTTPANGHQLISNMVK